MKKDLNFILDFQNKDRQYIATIVLIIIFCLCTFTAFILPYQQKNQLNLRLMETTNKLENYRDIEEEYANINSILQNKEKIKKIIEHIELEKYKIVRLLETIEESLPSHVSLTHFDIAMDLITIQGTTPDNKAIAEMIERLFDDPNIISIDIKEILLETERLQKTFNIQCTVLPTERDILEILNKWLYSDDLGGGEGN